MNDANCPGLAVPAPALVSSAGARAARRAAVRAATTPDQVLTIVCVGIVLANLDLFIVTVGLPNIAADFQGASLQDLSWVLNGYAIAYAALLIFCGRLAERHRRNTSFLLGVALFTAASAACAAAGGVVSLVAFRVAQAAGAALMTPTSLGLLLASFPAERRGAAVRTWTAIGGLAAALGPLVGGVLLTASWRWIFLVNVPIGLLALLVGWLKLPEVPGHDAPRPPSVPALLVTGGIAALTLAIVEANDWGWASAGIVGSLVAAVLLLGLFVRHCLTSANPFVDPKLFRVGPFTAASLVMAPYSVAFGAMLLSIALWQQTAWGWSALKAGAMIAPGPFLVPVTALTLAGRLIARFGPGPVVAAGIALFTGGLALWALAIGQQPDVLPVLAGIAMTGVGVGLTFPTLMGAGTAALPSSSFATGSGVINMIRQAGLAIGVAIFVAVLGAPEGMGAQITAFHRGWWVLAAICAFSLVPALYLARATRARAG